MGVTVRVTATIDPQVLATSNGYGGRNRQVGSTSFGSLTVSEGGKVRVGVVWVWVWVAVGAFLAF